MKCSIEGCDRTKVARGWCPMHWQRWRRNGNPLAVGYVQGDDVQRFWAKVTKTETCWLWTGSLTHDGYGRFRLPTGHVLAHRWSYEQLVGPIPEGLVLDHVHKRGCRHRNCVNPAHLEPVTNAVNVARAVR